MRSTFIPRSSCDSPMPSFFRFLSTSLLSLAAVHVTAAAKYRLTVARADVDRAGQLVTFTLPLELARGAVLHDAANQFVPLQIESDRTAQFIVPAQKAGEP